MVSVGGSENKLTQATSDSTLFSVFVGVCSGINDETQWGCTYTTV